MKKLSLLLILFIITLTGCYRVSPNAGEESVLVYKPYFFGHGGVDKDPVSTGSSWCAMTTDHLEFPITPVNMEEDFVDIITQDNTPISLFSNIKLQAISGQTPILYANFGKDWYVNSIQSYYRSIVRDQVAKYKMFDLASKREISTIIQNEIDSQMTAYFTRIKIPVNILQIAIGGITPPDEVLAETRNTAAQNQSILTQNARANAELSRKQAEVNKAIADQAYKNQMGMSTEEYLALRRIEIEKEKVELIKDNKNISIIFGNAQPTLPVKN